MVDLNIHRSNPISGEPLAVIHFWEELRSGTHWYPALLDSISLWNTTAEIYQGRSYNYLISNEALDWLLVAERILITMADLVPPEEKDSLLFEGKAPVELSIEEFARYLGPGKYQQHLNYFYGITIEQSLIHVVCEEMRKEMRISGLQKKANLDNEAFQRLYGKSKRELLKLFRISKGYPQPKNISLNELNEFTYWLFKYRLNHSDPARVASDTRKALTYFYSMNKAVLGKPKNKFVDI